MAGKEEGMLKNLDESFDICVGVILANRLSTTPVWLNLNIPTVCRSTVLTRLSNLLEVISVDTLTSATLISGKKYSNRDTSLLAKLDNRTLVIRDFTSILQKRRSHRAEILSILRCAYSGEISKSFANGIRRSYKIRFGLITSSISKEVDSFFSERFLQYTIPKKFGHLVKYIGIKNTLISTLLTRRLPIFRPGTLVLFQSLVKKDISAYHYQETNNRRLNQLTSLALGIALYRREKYVSNHTLDTVTSVARCTWEGDKHEMY